MHLLVTIMLSLSLDIQNIIFSYKNGMMSMSVLVHNFEKKMTRNEINVRNNIAVYYLYIIWAKYI